MKICVISFDFWGYDAYIVEALREQGVEANHIKIGDFCHKNFQAKSFNAFSKVFLNKNLKHLRRQEFVMQQLDNLGYQDQILMLNPDSFELDTIQYIKGKTGKLITFLYDNLERFPVSESKLQLFDKIFSFDDRDIQKFGFESLTNYNYLPFTPKENQNPENDVFYITSFDKKRLSQLNILTQKFEHLQLKFNILMVGKRTWQHHLQKQIIDNGITFRMNKIEQKNLPEYYKNTKVILDLMRENQYGLSFRVFEAMALEKKIITDNEKIKNYDFYNPNNILVLNKDFSNLDADFFNEPYQSLPAEIYEKYTLRNWVKKVFK